MRDETESIEQSSSTRGVPLDYLGVKVSHGVAQLSLRTFIVTAISFVFFSIITKLLPMQDIGIYSALVFMSQILITFFSLGMMTTSSRYVSVESEDGPVRRIIDLVLRYSVVAGLVSGAICFLFSDHLSFLLFQDSSIGYLFRFLAFDIFALVLASISSGLLIGMMQFSRFTLISIIQNLLRALIGLLLVLMGLGLIGVISGWIIGDLVGAGGMFTISILGRPPSSALEGPTVTGILTYAIPIYLAEILVLTSTVVDRFSVLLYLGTSWLAVYHTVLMVFSVVVMVSKALGSALFPAICRVRGNGDASGVRRGAKTASRYVFMVYLPLAIAAAVFSEPILAIVGGVSYVDGSFALILVSTASAFFSGLIILEVVIKSDENVIPLLGSYLLAVFLETVACVLLVPPLGILGAAIGQVVLGLVLFICFVTITNRRQMFSLDFYSMARVLVVAFLGWIAAWVGSTLVASSLSLYIMVPIYVVAVTASLRFLRIMRAKDYELLRGLLPSYLIRLLKTVLGGQAHPTSNHRES